MRAYTSLYVDRAADAGLQDDEAAYELALALDRTDLDAIVISCTNLPAIDTIQKLEDATACPS